MCFDLNDSNATWFATRTSQFYAHVTLTVSARREIMFNCSVRLTSTYDAYVFVSISFFDNRIFLSEQLLFLDFRFFLFFKFECHEILTYKIIENVYTVNASVPVVTNTVCNSDKIWKTTIEMNRDE